jgi:hypothetical protein
MKRQLTALILFLILSTLGQGVAGTGGQICDLTAEAADSTTISAAWNCTDKENPLYILTCRVDGVGRVSQWNTYRDTFLFNNLSPNTTYVITVSAQGGSTQTATVTTPAGSGFIGYNYQLLAAGVYLSDTDAENYTVLACVDGDALAGMLEDNDFSLMLSFQLTAAQADRALDYLLVLRLPNGDIYTASQQLWVTQKSQTVTEYFTFNALLETAAQHYAAFPVGEYTLTAYCNDGLAAETDFMVE